MRFRLALFAFSIFSFDVISSPLINHEQAEIQTDCLKGIFSDYNSWREFLIEKKSTQLKSEGEVKKYIKRFEENFSRKQFEYFRDSLSCKTFQYINDSIDVKGYVIKPKLHDKPLPVLIYNRGGNGSFGTMVFGSMMNNLFPVADQGFVIIGSQYRRSNSKYKLLDEFGGKDVDDVVALQKFIPAIVGADSSKVGMYGASRGSMQTFLALKKMNNIKAVASIAGVSDLLKGLEYRPEMENVYKKRIPLYEKNKTSELQRRSVLRWVDQLPSDVPVLLLHGTKDKRVSVNHSITLAKAFSKTGVPHKLVLYAGDSHGLRNNKAKSHKEIANWFKQHL